MTRYVKVQVSFVLCYDEALSALPEEMANVETFLQAGVTSAFVHKNRPNRKSVYICPYARLSASLIHSPRSLPQMLAQTSEGRQTFLTPAQHKERDARMAEAEAAAKTAADERKGSYLTRLRRREEKNLDDLGLGDVARNLLVRAKIRDLDQLVRTTPAALRKAGVPSKQVREIASALAKIGRLRGAWGEPS